MDSYVFASTMWPVNVICYVERLDGTLCYSLRAWGPPARPGERCRPLPLRIRTGSAEGQFTETDSAAGLSPQPEVAVR
jgi:hypothetical protein